MNTIWTHARIAPMAPGAESAVLDDGALVTLGERVLWLGAAVDVPAALRQGAATEHDLGGALVTPGLIDCHTHLVYGGSRAREFEMRLQGAGYEDIARAGGGIGATVAATRAASQAQLAEQAALRLDALLRDGVTTIEIKSGYGLSLADEARLLRVARSLGAAHAVDVRTSFLGAHALPPEFAGRPDDYIEAVCAWLPQLHAQGLVDAVDAFCDNVGFSCSQVERVFVAARALGLPVKLHAEQLSNQHGAAMAARFGALSCDHLEHLDAEGVAAMARSGAVAVLLPGAYYYLRETRLPPVAALRAAGVPIAVATDHNPGTSPVLSLQLMLNMACVLFGLTPWEALVGATANAARALGLGATHGRLVPGMRADFAVWDVDEPRELAYATGRNACRRVVRGGRERDLQGRTRRAEA
jgi:imidazolonepropionase